MMQDKRMSLVPHVKKIVEEGATERPFSGPYLSKDECAGTYLCRCCGFALFESEAKFNSGCGWPSFDRAIEGHVHQRMDSDGIRTEIQCARCLSHLGHVFLGEGFTARQTRHCVNGFALDFAEAISLNEAEEIIVAAGCFWGVEHLFRQVDGVVAVEVGYTGGEVEYPSYDEVCRGETGHYEAARVLFNPERVTTEQLYRYFFEIHNPEDARGQGPDRGTQYLSAVFYYDDEQKQIAERLIKRLRQKGYQPATRLLPVTTFWPAESYHQQYYQKHQKTPYCHRYEPKFDLGLSETPIRRI